MVKVITSSNCTACKATKKTLDKYGVPFEEVNVDNDETTRQEAMSMGYSALPVVIVDEDTSWSGFRYDRLRELAA